MRFCVLVSVIIRAGSKLQCQQWYYYYYYSISQLIQVVNRNLSVLKVVKLDKKLLLCLVHLVTWTEVVFDPSALFLDS